MTNRNFSILTLLVIFLTASCDQKPADPRESAGKELSRFSDRLAARFPVTVCGCPYQDWSEFNYSFSTAEVLTVEQMRQLLVELVSSIETELNSNEKISKVLAARPISFNELHVVVRSPVVWGRQMPDYVATVSMTRGEIRYYRINRPDEKKDFYLIHSESWEDALGQFQQDADSA